METSRNWVNSLERNIANCEDLLASRSNGMLNDLLCHPAPFIHPTHLVLTDQRIATDLAQLYSTYLQHTEFLKILRMVYVRLANAISLLLDTRYLTLDSCKLMLHTQ